MSCVCVRQENHPIAFHSKNLIFQPEVISLTLHYSGVTSPIQLSSNVET